MKMKMENESKTYEWKQTLFIPNHCIYEIGDAGMCETYTNLDDEQPEEKDDLRICLHLNGGTDLVLDNNARMIVGSTGVTIEHLCEV